MVTNRQKDFEDRCMSLLDETKLSPDLRVNYEFGLVLGVNEFLQEQYYHLHRDYLHNRALHGYGTVTGLNVVADEKDDNSDYDITVKPGIGVDQCGRLFRVDPEQCASLHAWLKSQEDSEEFKNRLSEDNHAQIYVVARYADKKDAMVNIAGQPCSTTGVKEVPSRIRDCFHIEFRWDAPQHLEWATLRWFGQLLSEIEFTDTQSSTIDDILEWVRQLRQPLSFGALFDNHEELRLPKSNAVHALDRIFTVWATEVRPYITDQSEPSSANLFENCEDSAILLATVQFEIEKDGSNFRVVDASMNDADRPFLLNTQLIQEALLLNSADKKEEPRQFASIHVRNNTANQGRVIAWIHHPMQVNQPEEPFDALQVFRDGHELTIDRVYWGIDGTSTYFEIVTEEMIRAEARVEVRFHLDLLTVSPFPRLEIKPLPLPVPHPGPIGIRPFPLTGDLVADTDLLDLELSIVPEIREVPFPAAIGRRSSLLDSIKELDYDYVGFNGNILSVYGFADNLSDVEEFVSIETLVDDDNVRLRLWFHAPYPVKLLSTRISNAIHLYRGVEEQQIQGISLTSEPSGNDFSYVWVLEATRAKFKHGDLLTLRFDTRLMMFEDKSSVWDWMLENQVSYNGYDGVISVTTHHIVEIPEEPVVPPDTGPNEEDVVVLIERYLRALGMLPFVTITPLGLINPPDDDNKLPAFELWFHLDNVPFRFDMGISPEVSWDSLLQVFAEVDVPAPNHLPQVSFQASQFKSEEPINRYLLWLPNPEKILEQVNEEQAYYLRFVFSAKSIMIRNTENSDEIDLISYMLKYNIKFEGYSPETQTIVRYVRVPAHMLID